MIILMVSIRLYTSLPSSVFRKETVNYGKCSAHDLLSHGIKCKPTNKSKALCWFAKTRKPFVCMLIPFPV